MGPFDVTVVMDRSDNPKLDDNSVTIAVLAGFIWLFISVFISMFVSDKLDTPIGLLIALIYGIPLVFIIMWAKKKSREFDKNKKIHGQMVVTPVNGQCIGLLKSNYDELATINIDELASNDGKVTAQRANGHLVGVWIRNNKAKIDYLGQETTCAMQMYTRDKDFLNLLVQSNITKAYVKPKN